MHLLRNESDMSLNSSCRKCGVVGKSICDKCKIIEDNKRLSVLQRQPRKSGWNRYNKEYSANRETLIELTWTNQLPCWWCNLPFAQRSDITADHYIPKARGGTDDISNLRPAHSQCNTKRGKGTDPWS